MATYDDVACRGQTSVSTATLSGWTTTSSNSNARLVALERMGRSHAALAAARQALRLDAVLTDAVALSRRVFAEVARPLPDATLRAAIGEASGLDGPYANPPE